MTSPTHTASEYVTREEAAKYLACSVSLIDKAAATGRLKRYKVLGGSAVRFLRVDLDALIVPEDVK